MQIKNGKTPSSILPKWLKLKIWRKSSGVRHVGQLELSCSTGRKGDVKMAQPWTWTFFEAIYVVTHFLWETF